MLSDRSCNFCSHCHTNFQITYDYGNGLEKRHPYHIHGKPLCWTWYYVDVGDGWISTITDRVAPRNWFQRIPRINQPAGSAKVRNIFNFQHLLQPLPYTIHFPPTPCNFDCTCIGGCISDGCDGRGWSLGLQWEYGAFRSSMAGGKWWRAYGMHHGPTRCGRISRLFRSSGFLRLLKNTPYPLQ